MELLRNDFRVAVQILSSIWHRKPIIICHKAASDLIPLMNEIYNFIPQYRQFIICGNAPKSIRWNRQKSKIIENVSFTTIRETLLNSFSEERVGKYVPLQLIYFDTPHEVFRTILSEIDRGWIALTTLSIEEVKKTFPCDHYQSIFSPEFQTTFLLDESTDVTLETSLLNKFKKRPDTAVYYLIQKTFAEIKSAGDALLHEIEAGRTIYPVELQEFFEMKKIEFQKCLSIIEDEHFLDISRFIKYPNPKIDSLLKEISQLDGIIWCCALQENHLVGMNRTKNRENLPLNSLPGFHALMDRFTHYYKLGTIHRFKIDLDDGHQLLFLNVHFKEIKEKIVLGILIETGKYAVVVLSEIETILNRTR